VDGWFRALLQPPPPERVLTLPVAAFGLLCLAGFVGAVLLTRPDALLIAARFGEPDVVQRRASVYAWLFGAGLFFLGVRLLQVNPLAFAAPVWLLLSFAAIVLYAIRIALGPRETVAA
jgi:hypothetical protein